MRRGNRFCASVLVAVVALVALVPVRGFAASAVIETFDVDEAGFTGNTTSSTVVHVAAGGNPGGHIQTRKDLAPPVFDIGAITLRPEFTGDYAAAGIVAASVDLNFMTDNIDAAWLRFRSSTDTNGWRYSLTNSFVPNVWSSYAVVFDPTWTDVEAQAAGWLMDKDINNSLPASPSFASVMADVYGAEVRIASVGSTIVGIDNVALRVPEPTTLAFAAVAAASALIRRRR